MNLARQSATRATRLAAFFFLGARRMLVGTHHRAADHQCFRIGIAIDRIDYPLPDAGLAPALEPRVYRVPVPQFCW